MDSSAKSVLSAMAIVGGVAVLALLQPVWLKKEEHTFSASAEAKVAATPDKGTMQFSVVTPKAATSEAAANQNNEKMIAVIAALKNAGVADADVATSQYTVQPSYVYDADKGSQTVDGYSATQTVTVTVRDIDAAGSIISAAIGAGANQVGSLNLTVDDPESARAQARVEAIEKAKAKAIAIAKESGLRLGKIVNVQVTEGGPSVPPIYYAERAVASDTAVAAPDIEPGTQEQVVGVTVTYLVR